MRFFHHAIINANNVSLHVQSTSAKVPILGSVLVWTQSLTKGAR